MHGLMGSRAAHGARINPKPRTTGMQVAVFDTYVTRPDGRRMHFDILVPNEGKNIEAVLRFGHQYLATKGVSADQLTARECRFCHIESASEQILQDIDTTGYHIIEMEHCD